jgi:hypothetical protein
MKVYVVTKTCDDCYYPDDFVDVFATREAAEQYFIINNWWPDEYKILEWEVKEALVGEEMQKWLDWRCHNILSNIENMLKDPKDDFDYISSIKEQVSMMRIAIGYKEEEEE